VDDTDLEAVREERPIAPAPQPVLRPVALAGVELRDVVPAVVVDDEQAATWPQDPGGLGDLGGVDATERRPARHQGVGPRGFLGLAGRIAPVDQADARPELAEPLGEAARLAIDERDVPVGERAQRIERARNLALDIESERELAREGIRECHGQVRHGRGV
jgi:hypothetical protein